MQINYRIFGYVIHTNPCDIKRIFIESGRKIINSHTLNIRHRQKIS